MKPHPLEIRFARVRAKARAALAWERWAPALLPGALLLSVYVAAALFGVWTALGDPWRLLGLIAALGGGAAWAVWALRRSRPATLEQTLRRIEDDSELEGRPFEAMTDMPAAMRSAPELWQAHVRRMAERTLNARARQPHAALAAADRWALRSVAVVVLLLGVGVAGSQAPGRIADAFLPNILLGGGVEPLVDVWIEPPDYTGAPPVFLTAREDGQDQVFQVPQGSELTVRVSGVRRPPTARLRDDEGRERLRFEALEDEVHEAAATLDSDAELTVRGAGRWSIAASGDSAPEVAFAEAPEPENNLLRLAWEARDDYGVETLTLQFWLPGAPEEIEEAPLDLGALAPQDAEGASQLDLTEHRWAGERAVMRLRAVDAVDQEGLSETVEARIPQRIFLSPLAKAVAEQRQVLMNETRDYAPMPDLPPMTAEDAAAQPEFAEDRPERRIERAPEGVQKVADMLEATIAGGENYFTDLAVYFGLAEARSEIRHARDQAELADVPPQLWRIALRVETGDLADAEAALKAAERALLEAMARGADADELKQLFDAYEQAMNRYLEALAREAIEEGRVSQAQSGQQGMEGMMNNQSVQDLLDAIREATELGDEAGARAALAALTELLQNMQMQIAMGGQGGGQQQDTPEQRAMRDALNELSDMIGDQRSLMDDTLQGDPSGGDQQGGDQSGGQQPGGQQGQQGQQPGGQQGGQQAGQGQQGGQQPGMQGQPGQNGMPGQNGQPGGGNGISPSDLAERQGGLGQRLDELGQQMGEGSASGGMPGGDPDGEGGRRGAQLLDDAREAMREAENALRQGDSQGALRAQEDALAALREGARQLAQDMAEGEEGDNGEAAQVDPLGRSVGGTSGSGDNVAIPDEAERQRARDILDELRRRAGERRRPAQELDYLRRLLERF